MSPIRHTSFQVVFRLRPAFPEPATFQNNSSGNWWLDSRFRGVRGSTEEARRRHRLEATILRKHRSPTRFRASNDQNPSWDIPAMMKTKVRKCCFNAGDLAWLRVGGPATAQAAWVGDFIRHCSTKDIPVDFVSTHVYGDDTAKVEGCAGDEARPKCKRGNGLTPSLTLRVKPFAQQRETAFPRCAIRKACGYKAR